MRRHYIDNLRWLCVLLLFPFHTSMIFNGFGENFYVRGDTVPLLNDFILVTSIWFMPLMFALAGISAAYALEHRTPGQFAGERFRRLLIPLLAGLLLLIPVQTYFAERFHNGYTGGYLAQYILFFTRPTDLSGYTGGFTPGHLWFILYLYAFSMLLLPLVGWYNKRRRRLPVSRMTVPMVLPLFLVVSVLSPVLNFGGKSMGYFFAFFILGYFILRDEALQDRLARCRWILLAALIVLSAARVLQFYYFPGFSGIPAGLLLDLTAWVGILTFMGLGKTYLNFTNKITAYLAEASFPVYVLHQSILVAVAFYAFRLTDAVPLRVAGIILCSAAVTFAVYEVIRRIPVTRFLFGIKKKNRLKV
jgi:glucan biosynthesis protein C